MKDDQSFDEFLSEMDNSFDKAEHLKEGYGKKKKMKEMEDEDDMDMEDVLKEMEDDMDMDMEDEDDMDMDMEDDDDMMESVADLYAKGDLEAVNKIIHKRVVDIVSSEV